MSDPLRPPRAHRWYRQRLAALRAGLLEPVEEDLLREHLEACTECREAHAAMLLREGGPQASDDHIPPDLLARWERVRTALRGLERVMVREHLARCAECRQDLELLGHVPELDVVPALEPAADALAPASAAEHIAEPGAGELRASGAAATHGPGRSRPKSTVGEPRRASAWIHWALGAWATAATAAAVFLIAIRPQLPGVQVSPLPGGSVSAPSPAAPAGRVVAPVPGPGAEPPALEPATVVVLERATRGTPSTDALPLTEVHPDTRTFVFGIPTEAMFDVPPGTTVHVELFDPSGQSAAGADFTLRRLLADRALVLRLEGGISPGIYRLRLVAHGHEPVETRFRVRVLGDP